MEAVHHNSSDSDTNKNLSPVQAQVIAALAQGRIATDAARNAGIHRTTIHHWFRTEPLFKSSFQEAQREYVVTLQDGMRDLAARAVETLRNLLDDPKTPPAVRLRTALAILQRPHFPQARLALARAHRNPARAASGRWPKRNQKQIMMPCVRQPHPPTTQASARGSLPQRQSPVARPAPAVPETSTNDAVAAPAQANSPHPPPRITRPRPPEPPSWRAGPLSKVSQWNWRRRKATWDQGSSYITDWSRDGRFLTYDVADPGTRGGVWILPLEGDHKPFPLLTTTAREGFSHFSPDGKSVAYDSDESGKLQVYVQPFPPGAGTSGRWQVSLDRGAGGYGGATAKSCSTSPTGS